MISVSSIDIERVTINIRISWAASFTCVYDLVIFGLDLHSYSKLDYTQYVIMLA